MTADEERSYERRIIKDLFKELAKAQSEHWPQHTFDQDGTAVMARLDTSHMLVLAKALQDSIEKAAAYLASAAPDGAGAEFAKECIASRRILRRQLMIHLQNGLGEYETENEDGQHLAKPGVIEAFGLVEDL